jgi:hypothetical protein
MGQPAIEGLANIRLQLSAAGAIMTAAAAEADRYTEPRKTLQFAALDDRGSEVRSIRQSSKQSGSIAHREHLQHCVSRPPSSPAARQ